MLRDGGYDVRDHQAGPDAPSWEHGRGRPRCTAASWSSKRASRNARPLAGVRGNAAAEPPAAETVDVPTDPFAAQQPRAHPPMRSTEMTQQYSGIIAGIAIASLRYRRPDGKVDERFLCRPGDDVKLVFPSAGRIPRHCARRSPSWTCTKAR